MNFQPSTEREISEKKLWRKGVYTFEIIEAAEKLSQARNPMIEAKLKSVRP
jgi:hypothetical protein